MESGPACDKHQEPLEQLKKTKSLFYNIHRKDFFMRTLIKTTVVIVLLLAMTSSVGACSDNETATTSTITTTSSTTTTTTTTNSPTTTTSTSQALTEAEVRAFADPVAANMMEGLSEADLDKYTGNADQQFKNAINQTTLDSSAATLKAQVGDYISIEYKSWEMSDGYIVVHYSVKYSKATIGVRIVFNQDHLVSGQWFE